MDMKLVRITNNCMVYQSGRKLLVLTDGRTAMFIDDTKNIDEAVKFFNEVLNKKRGVKINE
jgi:ribosomal protein S4E